MYGAVVVMENDMVRNRPTAIWLKGGGKNMGNKIEILAWFAAGYPQTQISDQTLMVYAQALADYDTTQLKEVLMMLLQTKKAYPSVAEIRQALLVTN